MRSWNGANLVQTKPLCPQCLLPVHVQVVKWSRDPSYDREDAGGKGGGEYLVPQKKKKSRCASRSNTRTVLSYLGEKGVSETKE